MIDQFLASRDRDNGLVIEAGYTPEAAVVSSQMRVAGDEALTVVFPPRNPSSELTHVLGQRALRQNRSILFYNLHPNMLSTDANVTRQSFEQAAGRIASDINADFAHRFERIQLLGFSMGNCILSMTAAQISAPESITMVTPGDELAEPFWTGLRTKRMQQAYKAQGVTLKDLQSVWLNLNPATYIEALRESQLSLVLARFDKYIPYSSGKKFADRLTAARITHEKKVYGSGHVAAIARHALRS